MEKDILILAVESSCDETAAAVVKNGREVLSNIISSQIALHTLYGGVVPEIASRKHIEAIDGVITQALQEAGVTLEDIDAIGVTYGPGLVGALLVGLAEAKALAFAANKPLVGVHHIEGHICANYIENKDFEPPYMALVVSGGHSHLVYVSDYGKYEILGCGGSSGGKNHPCGERKRREADRYGRGRCIQLRSAGNHAESLRERRILSEHSFSHSLHR